jgi:hypothetical protein
MNIPTTARRLPFVAAAIFVLLIGMWAGLLRMGWNWPGVPVMAMVYHGPLMIGGFLGTLLGLERAVAMRRAWAYGAPLLSAAGGISLLAGFDPRCGQWLLFGASLLLLAVFARLIVQQPILFLIVMGLGAAAWLMGNIVWLRYQIVPLAVPSWIAFLILTIVGERLELTRLLPRTRWRMPTFVGALAVYAAGPIVGLWFHGLGWVTAGAGMIALAAWLVKFDLARRTIHQQGLTRFVAASLLCGYCWLAIGGALAVLHVGVLPALHGHAWLHWGPGSGMPYDSIVHALLLGFVFAMIFGHAPIIFGAVLSLQMQYRPRFYAHLALLQLSVLLRIVCDLSGWLAGRNWAGVLNALAILLFIGQTISTVRVRQSMRSNAPAAKSVA